MSDGQREKVLQNLISNIHLKLRHAMLVSGMTPHTVDYALHKKKGWTASKMNKLSKGKIIELRDISDIATACNVEVRFLYKDKEMILAKETTNE